MSSEEDMLMPVGGQTDRPAPPQTVAAPPVATPASSVAAPPTQAAAVPTPPTLAPLSPPSRFSVPPVTAPRLANPPPVSARRFDRAESGELTAAQKGAGIAAGVFMAAFCTAVWLAIFIFTAFSLSTIFAPCLGFAVGFAVYSATKSGDEWACWVASGISLVFCIVAIFVVQFITYKILGHASVPGIMFGVLGMAWGAERGLRTPAFFAGRGE